MMIVGLPMTFWVYNFVGDSFSVNLKVNICFGNFFEMIIFNFNMKSPEYKNFKPKIFYRISYK